MIDKIVDLRNKVHKDCLRFVLSPEHWNILYVPESVEKHYVATVTKNGELLGYAAYYLVNLGEARVYDVREMVAEDEAVLAQLIDQIVDRSVKDNVDFVFARSCEDRYLKVYAKKGALSFLESVVMMALLNAKELLSTLSEEIEDGKVLRLLIEGFDPVVVKVGTKGIMVANKEERPDLTVSIDSKTFVRLFLGRASLLKEFLARRIAFSIFNWTIVSRFFKLITHDKWYIPMGDWV